MRRLGDERDDVFVDRLLRLVQERDELVDAALVLVTFLLPALALVDRGDDEPGVEERELAQAAREDVVVVLGDREDVRVGLERDLRARPVGLADRRERRERHAAPVLLEPDVALALDLEPEPLATALTALTPTPCRPALTL